MTSPSVYALCKFPGPPRPLALVSRVPFDHFLIVQRVVEVTGEIPCTSNVGGSPDVSSSSWLR